MESINILLLEDRYDDAEIIQMELERAGLAFECIIVKTEEAYREHLNANIDLILADYQLPQYTAMEALELLKSYRYLDIPFIIVSGDMSDELAVECIKKGATDYLLKDRLTRLGHAVTQALLEKALRDEAHRLEQSEREQRKLARVLLETVRISSSTLDIDTVMNTILENVGRVVPHDAANIMLIKNNIVQCAYSRGYSEVNAQVLKDYRFSIDHTIFQEIFRSGLPRLTSYVAREPSWIPIGGFDWVQSNIATPIQVQGDTIGFLNIDSAMPHAFQPIHSEWLLAFASEMAIAIENAQLYEQVRNYADELEQRVEERTQELLQVKQGVEAILNSTSDAIILIQPDYHIEQTNPAFNEMFDCYTDLIKDQTLEVFCDPASFEQLQEAVNRLRVSRVPIRLDLVGRTFSGKEFDMEVALSVVSEEVDSLIVCSIRDITQRKLTERELLYAVEQERILKDLKSRFVAIVSHEFRNPLSVIQMSSSTLERYLERLTDEQRARHFRVISSQVDHMTEMLEDILAIEAIESGNGKLKTEPTDFVNWCWEIVEGLRNSIGQSHQVKFSYSGTPLDELLIDQKLFRQVISNLVSNAIKYSPNEGTVWVELINLGDLLEFHVRDEGIGIPEKDQENLFQPFNRAGNTSDIPGTGLGLVIARNAIELHGGTIDFTSEVGQGTTFTISLPLNRTEVM